MSSADYDVAYCEACERCHLNGICPLTDKAQKEASMTDAGWAEKDARKCWVDPANVNAYAVGLRKEHARAVRIVKRHLKECLDAASGETRREFTDMWKARIAGLHSVLTALQRGRGGKG